MGKSRKTTVAKPTPRKTSRKPARSSLGAQIAGLRELTIHDLRILWRREHGGEPPVPLTRDLMVRAIAYRMQEPWTSRSPGRLRSSCSGFLRRADNPIPNRQFADGDVSYLAAPNPPAATVSGSVSG